jgi:hypothetical protein
MNNPLLSLKIILSNVVILKKVLLPRFPLLLGTASFKGHCLPFTSFLVGLLSFFRLYRHRPLAMTHNILRISRFFWLDDSVNVTALSCSCVMYIYKTV